MNSDDPYRLGRAYERRCEINGLKAAAKVFAAFVGAAYLFSEYSAPIWPMILLAIAALILMVIAYALGSIFTGWQEEDES